MNWSDLSMSQRSDLMQIYLKNGITSLDEMKKHYNSFAEGGFTSPDHDPNNPYHYHVNGQKVVVTPEDWEKYKNDPTFREVRAAVEAEQAAYPKPEYDEVENPAWRKAYQNLVNGVNLKGRDNVSQPLPQGYTRDTKGVVMDAQGNYYIPREQPSNAPYFINQERGMYGNTVPVRYEQQQMPDKTIRQLRQPLPVDRVMGVDKEKEKAITNYIINSADTEPLYYFDIWNTPSESIKAVRDKVLGFDFVTRHNSSEIYPEMVRRGLISDYIEIPHPIYTASNSSLIGVNKKEIEKYHLQELLERAKETSSADGYTYYLEKTKQPKPSRQEAEQNAIIPLNSFAEGGSPDIPPERFFGIATPEVTDNNVYQPTYGTLLPEAKVNAERPSWQHNLTNYDLARLRSGQISSETAKSIAEKRATGTSGYMKDVNKLSWIPNGAMLLAGGLSGILANPYLWGAIGLGSATQNIEDKNYGEAALDVGLTFLGPELRLLNKGVEATRFGKSARIASELNKAVKSTRLQPRIVENPIHNRFKLGDVEINNPNLFYRQGDGPLAEDLIESGIVRTKDTGKRQIMGTLNLTKPTQSNAMFNKGRVAFNPESDMGKNLITTSASDKMNATQPKTWTGDAVYVNNWHSNPITKQESTAYIFEPGYGYRRYLQEYIPTIEPSISDLFQVKGGLQRTANRLGTNINHYYNNVISPEEFMKLQHSVLPISEDFIQPKYIPSGFPYGLKESKILMPYDKMRQDPLFAKYKDLPDSEFKEVMDDLVGSHEFIHYHNNRIRKNILNNKYNPNMSESQKHRLSYDGDKYFQGISYPDGDYSNGYFLAGNGTEVNARLAQLYNIFNTNYLTPSELHIAKKFYPSSILDNDMTTFFNRINDEEAFLRTANDNVGLLYNDGGPIHIKPENRGKFTALKKRTGHSASWFKEHGTPAQKKMAVFALNAKKWRK